MKKNILLISLISLLFISCENSLSKIENPSLAENSTNTPAVTTSPSEDGKTYITFGDISLENDSRTINPVYNRDHLTGLSLKGMETAKVTPTTTPNNYTTFWLYTSSPKASSYDELCTRTIEITPGIWNFILYATLYDFEFSGMTTVEVKPGMTHSLNFTLTTTSTSSYPYGIIDITIDFTGNADSVVATLKEKSTSENARLTKTYTPTDTKNPITTVEGESFKRINFKTASTSSSSSGGVTSGKYYLLFEFYKDGIDNPIYSIENIVRVENNFTTKKTLNLDLDELYTISYSYWEGTAGFDTTELESLSFDPATTVLPSVYSRKSETFILPTPSLPGYSFDAWYKDTDFTEENKITQITQGSTGDLELYANFVAQSSGGNSSGTPDGLAYVDLGLPSETLWANMNVGATSVTDPGSDYFWSVDPVKENILAKYTEAGETLLSADDHATVEWGSNWITPTTEQIQELCDKCYFEPVTSYNGVTINGYVVYLAKSQSHVNINELAPSINDAFTYPENYKKTGYSESDPHIFLPARNGGNDVWMWSSTYEGTGYSDNRPLANLFGLANGWGDIIETGIVSNDYTYEYPIRPVYVGSNSGSGGNGGGNSGNTNSIPDDFVLVEGATITTPPRAFGEYGAFKYVTESSPITIQNFYMCTHEVTQAEYETYCIYGGTAASETEDKDLYPAYNINWYDAIVYCNLRSLAENLTPVYSIGKEGSDVQSIYPKDWDSIRSNQDKTKFCGPDNRNAYWDSSSNVETITINPSANGYRLPTNAEWEYAARGGNGLANTQTEFSGSSTLSEVSNEFYETIEKIMLHAGNSLGIYDMNSAVNEWFLDPSGEDDYRRISTAQDSIDYNAAVNPNERSYSNMKLGFRVVRNVGANGGANP